MSAPKSDTPALIVNEDTELDVSSGEENSQSIAAELNERLLRLFDEVSQSSDADLIRGYANETIGGAKLAVRRAIESPELTLEGIAQAALGAIQRFVGEVKSESDEHGKSDD
jgi:hypothetical protein